MNRSDSPDPPFTPTRSLHSLTVPAGARFIGAFSRMPRREPPSPSPPRRPHHGDQDCTVRSFLTRWRLMPSAGAPALPPLHAVGTVLVGALPAQPTVASWGEWLSRGRPRGGLPRHAASNHAVRGPLVAAGSRHCGRLHIPLRLTRRYVSVPPAVGARVHGHPSLFPPNSPSECGQHSFRVWPVHYSQPRRSGGAGGAAANTGQTLPRRASRAPPTSPPHRNAHAPPGLPRPVTSLRGHSRAHPPHDPHTRAATGPPRPSESADDERDRVGGGGGRGRSWLRGPVARHATGVAAHLHAHAQDPWGVWAGKSVFVAAVRPPPGRARPLASAGTPSVPPQPPSTVGPSDRGSPPRHPPPTSRGARGC